ncbi:MAG: hypothetical protein ACRD7E_19025, partial [Bryobacteraceae bacterium]
ALVAAARLAADVDAEAKALLSAASALSWVDRERCLVAVDEAAALCRFIGEDLLRAHVRGYCGYWHFLLRSWRDQDAEACAHAVQTAREANDRPLMSLHTPRYALFQALRSEYSEAVRLAREGMRLAVETGDPFDYMLCHFCAAWGLLHEGEWAGMLRVLESGMKAAERNGHRLWDLLFHVEVGWLHQRAFSYESSLRICEHLLTKGAGKSFPLSHLMILVLEAFAYLGLERWEQARQSFAEIASITGRGRILMDWMWQRQLQYGYAVYWFAQDDLGKAKAEAEELCRQAEHPRERTLLALGHRMLAKIASHEGDLKSCHAHLAQAIEVVAHGQAPLAAWQVYETAAQLLPGNSTGYWVRSAHILECLMEQIAGERDLRESLAGSERVKNILAFAGSTAVTVGR